MKKNKILLKFKKTEIIDLNQLNRIIGGAGNSDIETTHTRPKSTRLCDIVINGTQ